MNNVLVSIIVPVYRTPVVFLWRFLRSALNQTLAEIQLIAVDDASPDECPKILDLMAAEDDRVTVVHRSTNGRAGMARNDGLALAKGRYILFADADDVLQPDMCEILMGLAVRHDADIVACSWATRDPEGNLLDRGSLPNRRYDLTLARQKNRAYMSLTYALWNKLFRREAIAPLRFEQFEANIGEDTLFNIAAMCRSRTLVTTAYLGYDYTVHATSATGRLAKGMPYLRTLALSGDRIRKTLVEADGTRVARKYADRMSLKRFSIGCGWIAGHPDSKERSAMWAYWRCQLHESLLPALTSCGILAAWYRFVTAMGDASTVYRLTWLATRISDPLAFVDRYAAGIAAKRRFRSIP